jgi:hypothetical protein
MPRAHPRVGPNPNECNEGFAMDPPFPGCYKNCLPHQQRNPLTRKCRNNWYSRARNLPQNQGVLANAVCKNGYENVGPYGNCYKICPAGKIRDPDTLRCRNGEIDLEDEEDAAEAAAEAAEEAAEEGIVPADLGPAVGAPAPDLAENHPIQNPADVPVLLNPENNDENNGQIEPDFDAAFEDANNVPPDYNEYGFLQNHFGPENLEQPIPPNIFQQSPPSSDVESQNADQEPFEPIFPNPLEHARNRSSRTTVRTPVTRSQTRRSPFGGPITRSASRNSRRRGMGRVTKRRRRSTRRVTRRRKQTRKYFR